MEIPYIMFQSGGLKFLLGMEYIERIEQAGHVSTKTIPVFDFGRVCGLQKSEKEGRYTLVLRTGEERFGIVADLVEDIKSVREEDIIPLKAPVLTAENRYLAGAVCLEDMKPPVLYTLDITGVYKKVIRYEPDYWY